MKSLEAERTELSSRAIIRLFRGETVTIDYSIAFRREYPFTAKKYDGQTGIIKSFVNDAGVSIVVLHLFDGSETLVDRCYIKEARMDRRRTVILK